MKIKLKKLLFSSLGVAFILGSLAFTSAPFKSDEKNAASAPNTVTNYYDKYGSGLYSVISVDNGYAIPKITVTGTVTAADYNVVLSSNASLNATNDVVISNTSRTWFVSSNPSVPPVDLNTIGISTKGDIRIGCFCEGATGICSTVLDLATNIVTCEKSGGCTSCFMDVSTSVNGSFFSSGNYGGVLVVANSIEANSVVY